MNPLIDYRVTLSATLMTAIIFGNSLVIVAYKSNFRLRTPTYTFLVSLAFSDFLVGSVSLPLWIYGSVMDWKINATIYTIFISFDILSAMASSFHLMAISAERFMAVSRPFNFETVPARCYGAVLAVCWSLAVVLAGIWAVVRINTKGAGENFLNVYASFIFAIGIFLPLLVIIATNLGVFRVVRRLVHSEHGRRRNFRKERKTAMTLILVTSLFFIAWTPFFIVNMLAVYCPRCLPSPPAIYIWMDFIKWLHFSNSALNPLVYACRDREMRRTFKRILCCCKRSSDVFPQTSMLSPSKAVISRSSFGNVSANLYGCNSHMEKIDMKELYAQG